MMDMPPLLPCPMCGNEDGYTLSEGASFAWWDVQCKGCGRVVDECRSDRKGLGGRVLPTRWPAADEAWNEAGAHAAAEVAKERERAAKAAEDFLTRGRSPLGRSVAAAIRAGSAKS